jgi:predicted GH43/DUF377 family glycosyl hydrolase
MITEHDVRLFLEIVIFAFVLVVLFLRLRERFQKSREKPFCLKKFHQNPVMSPQSHNEWEACGVFNPAAYKDDDHNVHLLYRAIGTDGVSRLGYSKSTNGINFEERGDYPVFFLENIRGLSDERYRYDPVLYPSGGSWGGAEDPRLVRIEDTLYLTFNAFDGWDFIRIGVSSILEKDFIVGKWNWKKPILISPEGEIHKNWVLFPEKIDGKFAILHSISPDVLIDYRDSIEDIGKKESHIKSPVGPRTQKRENDWKLKVLKKEILNGSKVGFVEKEKICFSKKEENEYLKIKKSLLSYEMISSVYMNNKIRYENCKYFSIYIYMVIYYVYIIYYEM